MRQQRRTARTGTNPLLSPERPISLKRLADSLGLSPSTVSFVLNQSPVSKSIPEKTKRRIFAAARKFDYKPHFVARSLRAKRSYIIGVVVPEVSDGYAALVLSGIEDHLLQEDYFYFVVSHRHKDHLIRKYPRLLFERSVEGLIAVDTPCREQLGIPLVAVSNHADVEGVTSIILDHERAAALALGHLYDLGHRDIGLIKGQSFSSDSETRWNALCREACRLGLSVPQKLTVQLEGDDPSPQAGYVAARKLLSAEGPFTALVAFNDVSAIGAIRALREASLRVPEDVSVVGFDDIQSAAYQNPALTTVRQPLSEMGRLAARTVIQRIANGALSEYPRTLTVEPELCVRESTCCATPGVRQPAR